MCFADDEARFFYHYRSTAGVRARGLIDPEPGSHRGKMDAQHSKNIAMTVQQYASTRQTALSSPIMTTAAVTCM